MTRRQDEMTRRQDDSMHTAMNTVLNEASSFSPRAYVKGVFSLDRPLCVLMPIVCPDASDGHFPEPEDGLSVHLGLARGACVQIRTNPIIPDR